MTITYISGLRPGDGVYRAAVEIHGEGFYGYGATETEAAADLDKNLNFSRASVPARLRTVGEDARVSPPRFESDGSEREGRLVVSR